MTTIHDTITSLRRQVPEIDPASRAPIGLAHRCLPSAENALLEVMDAVPDELPPAGDDPFETRRLSDGEMAEAMDADWDALPLPSYDFDPIPEGQGKTALFWVGMFLATVVLVLAASAAYSRGMLDARMSIAIGPEGL